MDGFVDIALFRHGLTEANKRYAYLGWTDSPLCPIDKKKITEVPACYDLIQSSDLGRCQQTAKMLFPGNNLESGIEWREINFGEWEGRTYEELKDDAVYQRWLKDPFSESVPGGETYEVFSERVDWGWQKLIHRILEKGIRKAALVTHSGVIRYLLSKHGPEGKEFWEWQIPFGKEYELFWNYEELRRGERCTLLRAAPLMESPGG
ncbi:histidine phosphatase family protein [Bacillus sp. ISL-47]|uniref:histidine phosphatase family protein n=1 Tax=Bacillus sp. ISL-47 TaxID=2819130 RepID=UPI001BED3A98|nr:histidine phosphatase family protein [Bacillus sp. ISL-47]MBT2689178.1 histidine phosphatase family protein [Bacillus sp. ISL-47]MBT2710292.1 histidine phosphatase family protein [Pseudomonas sp. ISL-84]